MILNTRTKRDRLAQEFKRRSEEPCDPNPIPVRAALFPDEASRKEVASDARAGMG